jgi:O-antigen ligase
MAVVLGPVSLAIVGVAVLTSHRPLAVTVLVGTALVVGAIVLGVRHFAFLTLLMIGGRTAIDLAHPGVDEEALRLSVLITGLYTVISVIWLILRRFGQRPVRISPIGIAVAVVTAAAILSGLLSEDRVTALVGASRWVFLTVFVVVLDNLLTDQSAVRKLLLAVGASTVVPIGFGIWQFIEGRGRLIDGVSRIEGSFAHPNTYGFYLAVIGLALIAVSPGLPRFQRLGARVLLFVVIASLVLTYSRTSYAAFAVGVIVIAIVGRRWLLLGITLATIAVAPLVPGVGARLADLGEGATLRGTPGNSLTWRLDYWQTVVEVGEGRRGTGVGLGVVSELTDSGREPHNDFVRSFVELGAIGLAAYLGFLAVMGSQVYAALMRTRSKSEHRGLPRCLAEGFAGIFAAYLIESVTGNPMTQLILLSYVVALALAACQSGRLVAAAQVRPENTDIGRRPERIRG